MKETIRALVEEFGPSGAEDRVRAVIRQQIDGKLPELTIPAGGGRNEHLELRELAVEVRFEGALVETVLEMESRLANYDVAFDGVDNGDDVPSAAPAAYLPDLRHEPSALLEQADSEAAQRDELYGALEALDARSRDILQRRWLNEGKETLHELADEYGVSAERIRQIEAAALKKLRQSLAA